MSLSGYFPDRASADRAIAELQAAGFEAQRENAEVYDEAAYTLLKQPQGATRVRVNAGEHADQVRAVFARLGGLAVNEDEESSADQPPVLQADPSGALSVTPLHADQTSSTDGSSAGPEPRPRSPRQS